MDILLAMLYLAGLCVLTVVEARHLPPKPITWWGLLFGRLPYVALMATSWLLFDMLPTQIGLGRGLAGFFVALHMLLAYLALLGAVVRAQGSRPHFAWLERRVGVVLGALGVVLFVMRPWMSSGVGPTP